MADVENQQEHSLPPKRKPDLCCEDLENVPNKVQKLQSLDSLVPEKTPEENNCRFESVDSHTEDRIDEKTAVARADSDENGGREDHEAEEKQDVDEGEDPGREAEMDRKGKGIMTDDKGKGKSIKEHDGEDDEDTDEDDDDSSDGEHESDSESHLSDDPLAELDLDNILPTRTRRRAMQPGLYISPEIGNIEDDDDSDDSDA